MLPLKNDNNKSLIKYYQEQISKIKKSLKNFHTPEERVRGKSLLEGITESLNKLLNNNE